jgi:tRNA-2-methylthio-N6-dimethylallyladenosine synthase
MRTYHIETFGCQMNEHDSEGIAGILSRLGMSRVSSADQADVVVLNTCSVRDKPHRKAFARLDDFRSLKEERPELLVIVAGCMAQLIPDEIQARAPHVDLLVGPGSYAQLEDAVRRRLNERGPAQALLGRCAPDAGSIPFERGEPHRAWVNVMFGCDNYCAYCVVPYARGPEVSRRPEAIVDEVQALAEAGVVEVTLLGQSVNSYGRGLEPPIDFADLLARVNPVEGIRRIRFTTSHPKDLSPKLIDAMARLDRVCERLHLPVQAGSDSVLARMGRGHTADDYRRVVSSARAAIPDLALTTDVMVGFPGETEEDFEQTLALFEEVRYDQAFMFKYNDRPGT